MEKLLRDIRSCVVCQQYLPYGTNPVVTAHQNSRIAIIGQAPGMKVHQSGVPWDDASGKRLREWLGLTNEQFYDERLLALVPMGFCYPGKGKSGDLPPRPECAPLWHDPLMKNMPNLKLSILLGTYSQQYYLGKSKRNTLTETVKNFEEYLPEFLPLPHPSPRNRFWMISNPWFEAEVLPRLKQKVQKLVAEIE